MVRSKTTQSQKIDPMNPVCCSSLQCWIIQGRPVDAVLDQDLLDKLSPEMRSTVIRSEIWLSCINICSVLW
jgi:hypothetical protein